MEYQEEPKNTDYFIELADGIGAYSTPGFSESLLASDYFEFDMWYEKQFEIHGPSVIHLAFENWNQVHHLIVLAENANPELMVLGNPDDMSPRSIFSSATLALNLIWEWELMAGFNSLNVMLFNGDCIAGSSRRLWVSVLVPARNVGLF